MNETGLMEALKIPLSLAVTISTYVIVVNLSSITTP